MIAFQVINFSISEIFKTIITLLKQVMSAKSERERQILSLEAAFETMKDGGTLVKEILFLIASLPDGLFH